MKLEINRLSDSRIIKKNKRSIKPICCAFIFQCPLNPNKFSGFSEFPAVSLDNDLTGQNKNSRHEPAVLNFVKYKII